MGVYGSPDLANTSTSNNKNMIYCMSCGFRYSKKIRRCPQCGKKHAKPFYYTWWFWLLVVIVIFLLPSSPTRKGTDITNDFQNTSAEEVVISEDEYKAQCAAIPYIDIARNPNSYVGQKATFRGKVIQVQENGKCVVLRINVTQGKYGLWDDTVYVDYCRKSDNESRVLEDDIITIHGEIRGLKNYTAVLGNQISVPHVKAEYVAIN